MQKAFSDFRADGSALALPLILTDARLHPSAIIRPKRTGMSFQAALNELDAAIGPRTPLYLLLRREEKLVAVTFVPYLAKESERAFFLEHRTQLVEVLGEEHFSQSLICKEIGAVTDARSWIERDENETSLDIASKHAGSGDRCDSAQCEGCSPKDIGYKRNKCRLCDRRMKNKITPEALDALSSLKNSGAIVQVVSILYYSCELIADISSLSTPPPTLSSSPCANPTSNRTPYPLSSPPLPHLSHFIATQKPRRCTSSSTRPTLRTCNSA